MNVISKLNLRWKVAIMQLTPMAALLYFAWTGSPLVALPAIGVTLLLSFLVQHQIANDMDHMDRLHASATAEAAENARIIAENELAKVDNGRIQKALDSATANIMIADANNDIVYLNNAVEKMFRSVETQIREDIPGFSADRLLGANIDHFHKNPEHQRRIVGQMTSTVNAKLTTGGRTFKFTTNPIFDEQGQRLGTIVEWNDHTQEMTIETEVHDVVNAALHGDLGQRISLANKSGFLETLSEDVNRLLEVSEHVVNDTLRVFGALAHGDLNQSINAEYHGAFGQLKHDANATVSKFTEVVSNITAAAVSVDSSSSEISQGNMDLSQRTEQQAASLEETASSMEEMTSTVKQTADNAQEANQLAKGASKLAEKGGEVVSKAVTAMSEINDASQKISDIIGVIDEIAFQTNLLALNAAVEAARAGEQGRGFAVVATEVRNLAGRSATAAKEIKDLIEDSVGKVNSGTKLVNESGTTLDEIVNAVKKATDIIGEIAQASYEQSSGVEEVNKAVIHMDEMTQQNAALVEQAAAASQSMSEQAGQLQSMMQFFSTAGANTDVFAQEQNSYSPEPTGNSGRQGEERRSADRPWSPPAPDLQVPNPSIDQLVTAAAGSDTDWQEF